MEQRTGPKPQCATCGKEAVEFTVKKDGPNHGRAFFKCPAEHRNKWFWKDEWRPTAAGHPTPQQRAPPAGASGGGAWGSPTTASNTNFTSPQQYGGYSQSPAGAACGPGPFGSPHQQHQAGQPYPAGVRGGSPGGGAGPSQSPAGYGYGHAGGGGGSVGGVGPQGPQQPPSKGLVMCQIVDREQYGLSTPCFDDNFRQLVKQLPASQRSWDPEAKMWLVKHASIEALRQSLQQDGYQIRWPTTTAVQVLVEQNSPFLPSMDETEAKLLAEARCGPSLWGSRLFPYQRDGVAAGLRFRGRVLLADEMGLGKTLQALMIASCYPNDWPLLIICPCALRSVWRQAIREWLPNHMQPADEHVWVVESSADWQQLQAQAGAPGESVWCARRHIAIVSTDLASKMALPFSRRYRCIIVDEAHSLKERTTQRYQGIAPMARGAARLVLITGTPLMNRPIELWAQVDLLQQGLLGSYDEYAQRYCLARSALQQQQEAEGRLGSPPRPLFGLQAAQAYRGAQNLGELHSLLQATVMVRRLKSEVLHDLPEKIRARVPLQLRPGDLGEVTAALRVLAEVNDAAKSAPPGDKGAENARMQAWSAAYRATGPAKLPAVKEWLEELLEGPAKVLVFALHHVVLDGLEKYVKDKLTASAYMRIDGQTPNAQRDANVERFQNDPRVKVALLSLHVAATGLTLTAASCVVFAELDQNPANMEQAEARAHRIGQQHACVNVYYLMGMGTLDQQIWQMIQRKDQVMGATLDGDADLHRQQAAAPASAEDFDDEDFLFAATQAAEAAEKAWASQGASGPSSGGRSEAAAAQTQTQAAPAAAASGQATGGGIPVYREAFSPFKDHPSGPMPPPTPQAPASARQPPPFTNATAPAAPAHTSGWASQPPQPQPQATAGSGPRNLSAAFNAAKADGYGTPGSSQRSYNGSSIGLSGRGAPGVPISMAVDDEDDDVHAGMGAGGRDGLLSSQHSQSRGGGSAAQAPAASGTGASWRQQQQRGEPPLFDGTAGSQQGASRGAGFKRPAGEIDLTQDSDGEDVQEPPSQRSRSSHPQQPPSQQQQQQRRAGGSQSPAPGVNDRAAGAGSSQGSAGRLCAIQID